MHHPERLRAGAVYRLNMCSDDDVEETSSWQVPSVHAQHTASLVK